MELVNFHESQLKWLGISEIETNLWYGQISCKILYIVAFCSKITFFHRLSNGSSKIGHTFRIIVSKFKFRKDVNKKNVLQNWLYLIKNKFRKIAMVFNAENWLWNSDTFNLMTNLRVGKSQIKKNLELIFLQTLVSWDWDWMFLIFIFVFIFAFVFVFVFVFILDSLRKRKLLLLMMKVPQLFVWTIQQYFICEKSIKYWHWFVFSGKKTSLNQVSKSFILNRNFY